MGAGKTGLLPDEGQGRFRDFGTKILSARRSATRRSDQTTRFRFNRRVRSNCAFTIIQTNCNDPSIGPPRFTGQGFAA